MRASFAELRGYPEDLQRTEGYGHTLAEILAAAGDVAGCRPADGSGAGAVGGVGDGAAALVLTGSGSSHYVGKCVEGAIQERTGKPVSAMEAGELLVLGAGVLPVARPLVLVSIARSGDSPESAAVLERFLEEEPEIRHLVITCNPLGRLARVAESDGRVVAVALDERSCDRSLVMTSSFTSLAVAALALGYPEAEYESAVGRLATGVGGWLDGPLERVAEFPVERVERMLAVGSGALYGAALEASLKLLEMTDGRVLTRAETTLGLRHGPLCALREQSLLFMALPARGRRRAFVEDLLAEIDRKGLASWKILVGARVGSGLAGPADLVVELPALEGMEDEWVALASVVVAQVVAFRRCRLEGLRPDEPSVENAITRVVGEFPLHRTALGEA
jgi:tagatose-6-phosphate ketose/aldose isomerase